MMMIKEIVTTLLDIICKHIADFACVRTIDRTAAIKDKIVEETIDTNVSLATCFSILFWLSILLIIIVAKPNSTVKTKEKTVVSSSAKLLLMIKPNL